jgi:hypothetical protein
MPTAGRVSSPVGGVGEVECALVVGCWVVSGDEVDVAGAVVVAADDGVDADGVVAFGAGGMTMGGGMTLVAGAGRADGTVVTEDGVSTFGAVSSG